MYSIPYKTSAPGIFQGDLIIRTALVQAFADIKASPELLQYCFATYVQDSLTNDVYGEAQMYQAIDWIMKQDIPVVATLGFNEIKFPCVTVTLKEGSENAKTLGDTNYKPVESYWFGWTKVVGPITPTSKGTNTLTFSSFSGKTIVPNMQIVTTTGQKVQILAVDGLVLTINPAYISYDYTNCSIFPTKPSKRVKLESIKMEENYLIGCHTQGHEQHIMHLFAFTFFALMRYKQKYLEARGFDGLRISYGPPTLDPQFEESHKVYVRPIYFSGLVSQYWPKEVYDTIESVTSQPSVLDVSLYPLTANVESWKGSKDVNEDFEDLWNDPEAIKINYSDKDDD